MRHDSPLPAIPLDDPYVVLSPAGETLHANDAFAELIEKHQAPRDLPGMFGSAIFGLIDEACRAGRARGLLPIVTAADPQPMIRVAVHARESDGALGVLLIDMSDEVAWRRQLFERNRELTALNDISLAVSSTLELEVLGERIFEQISRIMRARSFYIALLDRDEGCVSFPMNVEDGIPRPAAPRVWANGITEYVIRTCRPLLLRRDVDSSARALGIDPIGRKAGSWLGAPMIAHGEPIGVIALQDYERAQSYNEHDREVLAIIASQVAAAFHNARLFAAMRKAYHELSETQGRLLEGERLRGVTETVGALNHEINNPLAAVAGNAQLLLRHAEALDAETRIKVESILEAARRIQRVTGRMATLIQAVSMPYPGSDSILDIRRSLAGDATPAEPPQERSA